MFAITIAGEGTAEVDRISSVLRGRRFRVETLGQRRATGRRWPSDGLVVVSTSSDRMQITKAVVEARRDDDVRFLPFALVTRTAERGTAQAFGAKAFVHFDGSPEELATEIRRMILREQESATLVHQLEGEIGALRLGDLLDTLRRAAKDAVIRVVQGAARGAIRVRGGVPISATFDALTGRPALDALLGVASGRFRVELRGVDDTDEFGALEAVTARVLVDELDRSPRPTSTSDQAPDAALAAALANAVTAYARRWMSEGLVARELEGARVELLLAHPALGSFRVSPTGIVLVENVRGASQLGGAGIGRWIARALERLDQQRPGRFGVVRVTEVVGGLARLLDQVGWRADFETATGGAR
ncbi:MAG: DUF4388 domain-containing protein [Myxococcales bacterium]|nr:DUF4388 domain-containing protein [Myxococcales bacterium]